MNWFIEILNLPDEGSYAYDEPTNTYRFMGEQLDLLVSDFSLLPGQGFGMWTQYQDGYFGFFRLSALAFSSINSSPFKRYRSGTGV